MQATRRQGSGLSNGRVNRDPLSDPEVRRSFEEELLFGEATETLAALVNELGISQRELARRLSVSESRVSQILSGTHNLTLRTLASLGWALGVRFALEPEVLRDRLGTPAVGDPEAPTWLSSLQPEAEVAFRTVELPARHERMPERTLKVIQGGQGIAV